MKNEEIKVSFEFFPPKTEEMANTLWNTVETLKDFNPSFVSVTYGAGGSTRQRTHEIISRIKKETELDVAAHLTCIGASKAEIEEIAEHYWSEGISHIVALRGDLPEDHNRATDGYKYANELVEGLKKIHDFEISVGGYPEKHPEAKTLEEDLDNLKRKVDAGADRIITQFFMDPEIFLKFREKALAKGIKIPIVPGILPVVNINSLLSFSKTCGASVPQKIIDRFETLTTPQEKFAAGVEIATNHCAKLYKNGVSEFHFYTLNRSEITQAVCKEILKM